MLPELATISILLPDARGTTPPHPSQNDNGQQRPNELPLPCPRVRGTCRLHLGWDSSRFRVLFQTLEVGQG